MDLVWEEDYTQLLPQGGKQPYQRPAKEAQVEPNVPEYIKSVYGIGYKFDI